MELLKNLKDKNELPVYSVFDEEFKEYGRVVKDIDAAPFIEAAADIEYPEDSSVYFASYEAFEKLEESEKIRNDLFGGVPAQMGICYGHNSLLNALEWHTCNEINVALTDMVIILARMTDLDDEYKMCSCKCKAFLVPKGVTVEVYSTSLHYCPCQASDDGFAMVVGLSKETNTDLEKKSGDPKNIAKNKWLVAHEDCESLKNEGCFVGISGKNYKINY